MIANPNDGNSPRVEVATPMIEVSAGGLITAKTEQEKGYVPGGTKSATQQLTTQGAKTVTPGTTAQTAVASGRYTTGDVVVAGDANLVAENIAEGVSIFGVTGTHSGGGGLSEYIDLGQIIATGTGFFRAYNIEIPIENQDWDWCWYYSVGNESYTCFVLINKSGDFVSSKNDHTVSVGADSISLSVHVNAVGIDNAYLQCYATFCK